MYCAVSVKDKKNLFNFVLIDEKTKMGAQGGFEYDACTAVTVNLLL